MASDAEVKLDLAIMHHPSRAELLEQLLARLMPCTDSIRTIVDPYPTHIGSAWRTAREAWSLPAGRYTHRLVLQDDAWPCAGFPQLAAEIIRVAPWAAIAFWVGEDHVDAPLLRRWGGRLCPIDQQTSWTPTVALALPMRHALSIRPHGEECHAGSRHDDEIIACYLRGVGVPLFAVVPSLVDHPGARSLTGLDHQGARRAALWIGETDPLTLDWDMP